MVVVGDTVLVVGMVARMEGFSFLLWFLASALVSTHVGFGVGEGVKLLAGGVVERVSLCLHDLF